MRVTLAAKIISEKNGLVTLEVATVPLSETARAVLWRLFPNTQPAVEELLRREAMLAAYVPRVAEAMPEPIDTAEPVPEREWKAKS